MNKEKLAKFNNYSIFIFILGLAIYLFFFIINGEDSIIHIYDNLDSEITTRLLPKRAGNLFSISNNAIIPQVMNGLPRNSLNASAFNFVTWLFFLFPPFTAYLINFVIAKIIAFTGVYLLFSNYILKKLNNHDKIISGLLAFNFTILHSFTIYGIAVLGLPLLIYCIINIVNGRHIFLNMIFVIFYPFYSSLVLGGHVVLVAIFVTGVWYYFKTNKPVGKKLVGISILLGSLYFISEINLINQFLFSTDFVSHRTAWDPTFDQVNQTADTLDFYGALDRVNNFFWYGEINARVYPMMIFAFFVLMLIIRFKDMIHAKRILALFGLLVFISFLYGFYFSDITPWIWLKNNISLLKTFRIDRIFFFWSVLWYSFFALLIGIAFKSGKKTLLIISYIFLFLNLIYTLDYAGKFKANIAISLKDKERVMISYRKYFAEDLFDKIKEDIDEPLDSFRVVSFGLHPSISLYNGFYTIDAYSNNYRLDYKTQFRRIIAPELEKSAKWKTSFDKWGGEAFIVSSDIEDRYEFIPTQKSVEKLEINTDVLYEMGGRYVISALDIRNYKDINLEFLKTYTDKNTPLIVYMYKVLPPSEM